MTASTHDAGAGRGEIAIVAHAPVFTPSSVAVFGTAISVVVGKCVGDVVMGEPSTTTPQQTVGVLVQPVDGEVWVETSDRTWRFNAGRLSFYGGDDFTTGDDWDWFSRAFLAGNPLADFDQNGFTNGEDADAFAAEFLEGVGP